MFYLLNKLIIVLIPIVPKFIVKIFANKYVAGETTKEAFNVVKRLNKNNLYCTLDILGEHTSDLKQSIAISNKYQKIIQNIEKENLDCNISIKPSHIGSDISDDIFKKNISGLLESSRKYNGFIRIDMEDSKLTDLTIKTYKSNLEYKTHLGIVFQAYLKRTESDIKKLDDNANIRLCKGIYNESESIAIKNSEMINTNYLKLLEIALDKNIFIGIATHDEKLIYKSLDIIRSKNINKNKFEFQMLYGVPMNKIVKELLKENINVRVYVPYGKNWYDYSIRRIKENPNISKYIIQNLFK